MDDFTRIVEIEVGILVAGVRDGEEGHPWPPRRGRGGGSENGGAVLRATAEIFAGAGVLGVDVFAHGCCSRLLGCDCGERQGNRCGYLEYAREVW